MASNPEGTVTINSRNFLFSRPPPEGSEMQDGAHFTATQLVRAGFYNYLISRSVFVVTLYSCDRLPFPFFYN
jgi:hypothetical protein